MTEPRYICDICDRTLSGPAPKASPEGFVVCPECMAKELPPSVIERDGRFVVEVQIQPRERRPFVVGRVQE